MSILVTGGAGFIGSHYVRSVLTGAWGLGEPESLVVLDKLTYAGNVANLDSVRDDPRLRFVQGDILDRPLVDELVAAADAVVHLAAESHVDRSIRSATEFVMTNVVGTQTLLDAAVTQGIDRFVHVSTDEVYGSIDVGSCDEAQPLQPSSPYSASKASADLIALAYHRTHGLSVSVTRGSNTFGPHQFLEKLIPLFITNLLGGGTVPMYGDGSNVREWLHVDDHCRAVHMVLLNGRPGEIYNVGGGTELTNKELTGRLLEATDASWDRVRQIPDRLGHDHRYSVDSTKIRDELDFEARVAFEQGLAETVQWYRDRRDWWGPLKEG